MKLVRWSLMGGLLRLVQRWGAWAGPQPAQAPHRCTKCNSPPINGQCTNHRIPGPLKTSSRTTIDMYNIWNGLAACQHARMSSITLYLQWATEADFHADRSDRGLVQTTDQSALRRATYDVVDRESSSVLWTIDEWNASPTLLTPMLSASSRCPL